MNAETDAAVPYLNALRSLAPLVAEHRADSDTTGCLAEPVFGALAEAGLFRLWLPRSLGGAELSPLDFMRVVEAASALDGSVGWLVGNGGGMSRAGGYLTPGVAREIFASPHAFITSATGAVGTARQTAGGYHLSGRWPFGSGAPHATHFMMLAAVDGGAPHQSRFCCYLPRNQVTVLDTWHVSGLRGTGSHDFVVDNVFVPEDHAHPFPGIAPTDPGLLYRMPALSVFAWTVAVVPLGIARGAMDAFGQLADRTRFGTPGALRESEAVQAVLGRIQVLYCSSRSLLAEAMSELMVATELGGQRLIEARVMLRAAAAHAAETAQTIIATLSAEAGAVAIFESCLLERALRDAQAAAKHVAMNHAIYVAAGRLAMGLDPGRMRF